MIDICGVPGCVPCLPVGEGLVDEAEGEHEAIQATTELTTTPVGHIHRERAQVSPQPPSVPRLVQDWARHQQR